MKLGLLIVCRISNSQNIRSKFQTATIGVKSSVHTSCKPHLGGAALAEKGLIGHFPSPDLLKLIKCE